MTSHTRTRRTTAHRIARTAGWLTVSSLLVTAAIAPAVQAADPVAASTPIVGPLHYGSGVTVDGDRTGWTSVDHYADMFRAAKPDKPAESTLYLRYDCTAGTLGIMVETVDGVVLDTDGDQFVKVDGVKKVGSPNIGDFTVSEDAQGWEASFAIAQGDYSLNVHAQVLDGGSQTSAVQDRDIPLSIVCAAVDPSTEPSSEASQAPSSDPSQAPSSDPSQAPSSEPTSDPTVEPSQEPSSEPSSEPTSEPSSDPSKEPSSEPTSEPTSDPSVDPSQEPSQDPSSEPTTEPSSEPTTGPSSEPSSQPSADPSVEPSQTASDQPTPTVTPQPTGGVEGATGTPMLTPPPTDTPGSPMAPASEGWRLALLGLAGLIAAALLLGKPRESARRR